MSGGRKTPTPEAPSVLERAAPPPCGERERLRARIVAALRGERAPAPAAQRLGELVERFALDPFEADTAALLWVGAFDPELRAEVASREPYAGQVTPRAIARLFGHAPRVRLASESPLLTWRMVQEHALMDGSAALALDPAIVAWLEGRLEVDRALVGRIELLASGIESARWPLDEVSSRVLEGWERGMRCQVFLRGDDALAARWCACALGRRLGMPVLAVAPGALADVPDAAIVLHRQAWLDGCAPCTALEDGALARPPGVRSYPLHILWGDGPGALLVREEGVLALTLELPPPDARERERLWLALCPPARGWPDHELADLAVCHEAQAMEIAATAATLPVDAAEAAARLREAARGDVAALARRIDAALSWDDLVLPAPTLERLHEIAFEARERARVWAEPSAARLFPCGRGLVALLAGPPGTGKTMAAQVIAADIGLDLLAVDISAIVSKWVGETAQHLQALLSSRTARRAVLFFDEADALYAKRIDDVRDAHDRYANLDTGHLMTALENHPGIVLLATNLKANIDSAFLRRIRHVVDFPKPSMAARARIWRLVIEGLFGPGEASRLEADLGALARIEATGAVIKNAALSALFAARARRVPADAKLLATLLARELAKEGAGLSAREIEALADAGSAR
jgi:hypothetical protein